MYALDPALVEKNVPEHDEMRRLVAGLGQMEPTYPDYDEMFMALMRNVMLHVADEETILLPRAERMLARELDDLGARMTVRRLELTAARLDEIAHDTLRVLPTSLLVGGAGAVIAGAYVLRHAFRR